MATTVTMTYTVLGTTFLPQGLVRTRVKAVGGSAYPVAGFPIAAADCGLKQFKLAKDGASFVDPVVVAVNQSGLLAEIQTGKVLFSFPSGGAATAPAAGTTAPVGLAATGAATASAVDATRPTVGLTPGCGKAAPASCDLSTITIFIDAVGIPA
jgi:hypothetical protein